MHIRHLPSSYSTPPINRDALLDGMHDLLRRRFDPLAIRENARRRFGYPAIANRLCAVYERLLRHEHQEVA